MLQNNRSPSAWLRIFISYLVLLFSVALVQQSMAQQLRYEQIDWVDLIPPEDLEALSNPPAYIADIEDGSFEDQIANQVTNAMATAADDAYQRALSSTKVVAAFDGRAIELPGYIVPLAFNEDQKVTQFFLVPYFGACIHTPPPPPNQMVFIDYPKGLVQQELYKPFSVKGVLSAAVTKNDTGVSAYSFKPHVIEEY